jgi:hypothetical protein
MCPKLPLQLIHFTVLYCNDFIHSVHFDFLVIGICIKLFGKLN